MADTTTAHYSWVMPQDHGSDSTWGVKLNGTIAAVDAQVWGDSHGTFVSLYNAAGTAPANLRYRWQVDTTTESGTNVGSNLNLVAYDNTGVAISPVPMTISRSTGVLLSGGVTFGVAGFGYGWIHSPATIGGTGHGGIGFQVYGVTPGPTDALYIDLSNNVMVPGGRLSIGSSAGGIAYGSITALSSSVMTISTGQFVVTGSAAKPGGGSWADSSDARIKTVEDEYLHGLDEVCQLRPVVYRYKGNDGFEPHRTDKTHIGLVAQEVEEIMPEMVTKGDGVIDSVPVDDLRTLDTTALLFALVNAVRRLKAEIEELKAR